ncbi:unnamed protein product [Discosporangium mesarthrocarpum]
MPRSPSERVKEISRVLRSAPVPPHPASGMSSQTRPPITAHALDTARGIPAFGLPLKLERLQQGHEWIHLGRTTTNEDGRAPDLIESSSAISTGTYRVIFDTAHYFQQMGETFFYPEVTIMFYVEDASQHYHIPLLLSPFGYTTYRGS